MTESLGSRSSFLHPARSSVKAPPRARGLLAALAVVALPFGTAGMMLVLALVPLWFNAVRSVRFGRSLQLLLLACVPAGAALAALNPAGGTFDFDTAVANALLPVRAAIIFSVLVWARSILGVRLIVLIYGCASLAGMLLEHLPDLSATTIKYFYSWPLALVILAVLHGRNSRIGILATSAAIAILATVGEYRSLLAFVTVAAALCLLHPVLHRWLLPRDPHGRVKLWPVAIAVSGVGIAVWLVYGLAEQVLLSGALGTSIQLKTLEQIQNYGSLIGGGRTEAPITLGLITDNPLGYGPGFIPTSHEYSAGAYDAVMRDDSAYLNAYVFGGHIRLHSFWGDLWVNFGIVGLITVAAMLALLASGLLASLRSPMPDMMPMVLIVWGTWNVIFSPIYSNLMDFALIAAAVGSSVAVARKPLPGAGRAETLSDRRWAQAGASSLSASR